MANPDARCLIVLAEVVHDFCHYSMFDSNPGGTVPNAFVSHYFGMRFVTGTNAR